jgi:hypothetical protein
MKTILYSLIAIFIFGIIASGFRNKGIAQKGNAQNSMLIQSVDKNTSMDLLSHSAKIIAGRLKDFSTERFDIKMIPEKDQILVEFTNSWNLKTAENLLIQKGEFSFYETYNRANFSEFLNGNNQLFLLLKSPIAKNSDVTIGCTSVSGIEKVTVYLNTLGINQKCKFAWEQHSDNSNACLYALKSENGKALIDGKDIESIKANQDKATKANIVDFTLKKSAADVWADATKRNINQAIAILLDGKLLAAPIVRSVINEGKCEISGNYTEDQVRFIAAVGNNGVLPLKFKIVH